VAAASGEVWPVKISAALATGAPLNRYVPSVERAGAELGLQAWIPLDEAIRKTLAWQRSARAVLSS
jgi:dTDP-glucose 4,6-dehydratase